MILLFLCFHDNNNMSRSETLPKLFLTLPVQVQSDQDSVSYETSPSYTSAHWMTLCTSPVAWMVGKSKRCFEIES